ncbi:hypothetical protein DXG03_001552 [Asterophora parasitica]|uniref:Integrase zinc-binding domain-containing protein n=1 Tax=Asterophora parasitica TaxID=117018 RepID=A0A9P7KCS2_9AGAR|nr:hypothetical protein DXG03_001552 [Asterophora parasitica]
MSPDRKRTPTPCSSKPYSRQATLDTPPTNDQPQTAVVNNKLGFPTHAQYKQIEAAYLASLNSSRREKALISQELFDRIWAVLHDPDLETESSQFRFWVRRKFTFGTLKKLPEGGFTAPKPDDGSVDEAEEEEGQTVVLHEKNLVAVQDQIYDILCYSHGTCGHAGRDKTCASVRQHYTWIPKDLVARFIKACPTCIAKKCGIPNEGDQGTKNLLPNLRQYLRNISAADSDEKENVCEDTDMDSTVSRRPEPDSMADLGNRLNRVANQSAPPHCGTVQSLPMTREVSLYQGLPNGWQFRHDSFSSAQEEFLLKKGTMIPTAASTIGGRTARPRVPSIAPMTRAFTVPLAADNGTQTPLQTGDRNAELGFSPSSPLPMIPRQDSLASQIDPVLLSDDSAPVSRAATPMIPTVPILRPVLPPSITRAAAPPALNLEALGSQKAIQAFLVLRDTHSLTPESSDSFSLRGSPTGSDCSQLSSFPMSAQSSASPTSTALATPVDVVGPTMGLGLSLGDTVAKDLAEKAVSMVLSIGTEAAGTAVMVQ